MRNVQYPSPKERNKTVRTLPNQLGFMARNAQTGETFALKSKYPRKELLEMFGYAKASKMYCDPDARHVGWIIGPHWFDVYRVFPLEVV